MIKPDKYIFLDNDGVLNTLLHEPDSREDKDYYFSERFAGTQASLIRVKVDMLVEFINEFYLKIIVSSSWRCAYKDLDELKKDYEVMGLPSSKIMGMTRDMRRGFSSRGNRNLEIFSTVDSMGLFSDQWVAFDDEINPHLSQNFIKTSSNVGLEFEHLKQAEKILRLYRFTPQSIAVK